MKKLAVVLIFAGLFFAGTAGLSGAENTLQQRIQKPELDPGGIKEAPGTGKKTDAKEEELFAEGIKSYESENYPAAVDIFQRIIDMNPDNAEAGKYLLHSMRATLTAGDIRDELFLRGLEQFLQKEYEDAAELFQLVLGMNPDHGKAENYLAKAQTGLKQVKAQEKIKQTQKAQERKLREESAAHSALRRDAGPYLVDSNGSRISTDILLEKKYVLLYFSASWCPPCREYTPKLVEFYEKHSKEGKVEVILVSWDRSSGEMFKYMRDYRMTWSALPYERAAQRTLSKKYNVTGIPRLIALDSKGGVIMDSARVDRHRMLDELARKF